MEGRKTVFSYLGIGFGAAALLLAVVHFWAGPFSPQPTIEEFVAEKAVSIKEATLAKLKGEELPVETRQVSTFNADRITSLATAVLGVIALIWAVVAFATNEPPKAAVGAGILGASALAFQFAIMALGAIVLVLLIVAVLGHLGTG
ncbi:hypothetical protein [Vibrio sp. WXL103]|uniref:hypothetical protein n=1 Tax=Vibrio sp. WXL103 TaxID=3450710 RepID=UPI003EC4B0AA